MARGGGSRGRGNAEMGGKDGRGTEKGRGRDGGRDRQQQTQQAVLGRGRSSNWYKTNPQVGSYQGTAQGGATSARGHAGGGRDGRRRAWIPRSQPERQSSSHAPESAGNRGRGTGGAPSGRTQMAASTSEPKVDRAALPSSQPQSAPVPLVTGVTKYLASTSLSSSNNQKFNPIMRPDEGGKVCIKIVNLDVNHFHVKFDRGRIIRHYDVAISPVESPRSDLPAKLPKPILSNIRSKLFTNNPEFPLSMTAYDGEKNIFSAVELPDERPFKVELSEGEDSKSGEYIFSIKLVNQLKLCKLHDYLFRNASSVPRDILQGMDVVMKENSVKHMIPVGRCFHPTKDSPKDNLGHDLTASRGMQYSLKPTFQGLALCLDYSVLAFRKKLPVLEFLAHQIPRFDVNDFERFRSNVEEVLKKLKVNVTHRLTKHKYAIVGLTSEKTSLVSFSDANHQQECVRIVDYFKEKYNKNITYLDIPCLDVSKNNRKNYIPMEYCVLAEGQIYPKEYLSPNAANLLNDISFAKPHVRRNNICDMVGSEDGPCGGNIIQNFGIEVNTNMTSVKGRVINPPVLKLAATKTDPMMKLKLDATKTDPMMKITVDKKTCHWNLVEKAVVLGKTIQRWGVIDFTQEESCRGNYQSFILKLRNRCTSLGMRLEEPVLYEMAPMSTFSNVKALRRLLERVTSREGRNLQFLLCVMSWKDDGYKRLKWISETKIGVVTQCCLSKFANKGQDQYLANLALKINAKLGGSNVELYDQLSHFFGEGHVMFVGADVNHPAPGAHNKCSPSMAAVVATMNWPQANRYAARVRPQPHRKEKIVEFGEMCLELVDSYDHLNKAKPEKIVLFRDGVSEGQFDMVLNEELRDLKRVLREINYYPTITLIVAQKRHQTRFFPVGKNDGGPTGNISPGTVVDTTIVHPFEFDFYLCSHHGSLGTSKPTHYHVLWDEHRFSSDQLQKLIYHMCFTFARCTKPVSLVPPVYYADLVAYRGRLYNEAMIEIECPSASFQNWFKLHTNLENMMFFV